MQTFAQNVSHNSFQIVATIITMLVSLLSAALVNSLIKRQQKASGKLISGIQNEEKTGYGSNSKIDELIQTHHEQALAQATVQFWFSISASAIGFLFIIFIIVFIPVGSQWYDYVIKVIPGIIIEAVSLLFFSQSKETRERASDLLNRLREDRQILKSILIIDSINDDVMKSALKANIALYMNGISEPLIISLGNEGPGPRL